MDDELFFAAEVETKLDIVEPWEILIVDDEVSVHEVTQLALHRFEYLDRPLAFTCAYSKKEAIKILQNKTFAVAFIDVIMETEEAGLELVNIIRKDIGNDAIRLIIRTGQPGSAPERFIIDNYDINDYKEKTELTSDRLYTSLRTALAQYAQLLALAHSNKLLYHRMSYDTLTGAPNRNKLNEDLEQSLLSSLFMINIDSFSSVNDAYGFNIGDTVLKKLTVQLQKLLLNGEVLYHLEADTFAIHIVHKDRMRVKLLLEEVTELSHHFHFHEDGISVRLSFSMGIVMNDQSEMIAKADLALKQARSISRHRTQLYSDSMSIIGKMHENREWTRFLNKAFEEDGLKPYFQPILNVKTQKIEKYEALVRMDINGSIVSPLEFLPAARYAGLLHEITKVMIEKTAKIFANNSYKFSINVTDQDFKEESFVPFVKNVLRKYKIEPSRVVFELLEEKSLKDMPQATSAIKELQKLGCHISIDDFGVECSNYAQLMTHELESIKIDGSFVKNLDNSETCLKVVDAIIYFAKSMNVKTVAEFVHSEAVYDKAVALGVDYVQGYYIGRPEEFLLE